MCVREIALDLTVLYLRIVRNVDPIILCFQICSYKIVLVLSIISFNIHQYKTMLCVSPKKSHVLSPLAK
jgi:hypothetical protein